MNEMTIINAQYVHNLDGVNSGIKATVDGAELHIPLSEGNRHYDEIIRQVDAGTLTIAEAE